jgi:hypothetical protein
MKEEKYHIVETVQNNNRKIIEIEAKAIPLHTFM